MASVSGTTAFNYNQTQIISRALRICGAIQQGEAPGASEYQEASDALNAMVKQWDARGIHVWKESEGILFFQPNQISYNLGPSSPDKASVVSAVGASFIQNSLASAAVQGTTSIALTSATGIQSGDNIGILLSANNALSWNTVSGTPTNNVVQLSNSLSGAAQAGALIVDYSPSIQMPRPLRIINGRRFQFSSLLETPLGSMLSRLDYRELPNKTSTGIVNQAFYDAQLTNGVVWVWPAPPDSTYALKFTWMAQIDDYDVASNIGDFPQEWINTLCWNLAEQIMIEYDVPEKRAAIISAMAQRCLEELSGWDKEPESVFMGVNFDQSAR